MEVNSAWDCVLVKFWVRVSGFRFFLQMSKMNAKISVTTMKLAMAARRPWRDESTPMVVVLKREKARSLVF